MNVCFEFGALFHHLYGEGKRAAISKLELFLTEWSHSYFVFALIAHDHARLCDFLRKSSVL